MVSLVFFLILSLSTTVVSEEKDISNCKKDKKTLEEIENVKQAISDLTTCCEDQQNTTRILLAKITAAENHIKKLKKEGKELKEPAKCQNGWKKYKNHCYYFAFETKTWNSATKACEDRGAYLVKIDNTEENAWIKSVLLRVNEKHPNVWIGLNDQVEEGKWRWVSDNSDVGFNDWHKNEPRHGTSINCVQLWYNNVYRWDDTYCNIKNSFICERSLKRVDSD